MSNHNEARVYVRASSPKCPSTGVGRAWCRGVAKADEGVTGDALTENVPILGEIADVVDPDGGLEWWKG